jgi:WD40 repeat protein/serine/threonine protein kinase
MTVDEGKAEQWAARSQAEEQQAEPAEPPTPGTRQLGDFELITELGRGGMGVVFRAWQPSLGRQVALKSILATGDPKAEARFAREIHALGHVEHPNLVKIFTSGSDGDRWFYAMELLEGTTLAAVCDKLAAWSTAPGTLDLPTWRETVASACSEARQAEKSLSDVPAHPPPSAPPTEGDGKRLGPAANLATPSAPPRGASRNYVRQTVELVRQVAGAAHALHEAGVIHRDIKPGNILVTEGGSHAVLMDLGLAQLADQVQGRLTRTRTFIGTLRYASPEQVLAVASLDRRSDIYSLGATLWELLTLRPMFGATEQTPTPELMQRIQYEEPERLRRYHPGRIGRDLEAVVHKCLEKDPKKRYATAAELGDELGRVLEGQPVAARPVSGLERGWRWAKRRPAIAALSVAVALTTLVAIGLLISHWRQEAVRARDEATHARDEAVREGQLRQKAEAAEELAENHAKAETQAKEAAVQARQDEAEARRQAEAQLYLSNVALAQREWLANNVGRSEQLLNECPLRLRGWEWHYLKRLQHSALLRLRPNGPLPVQALAFSPDSLRIVATTTDPAFHILDAVSGRELLMLVGHGATVTSAAFSPDGRTVVSGSKDRTVRLWDAATGQSVAVLQAGAEVRAVAFRADGKQIASAGADGAVRIWDLPAATLRFTLKAHTGAATCLAYSPDGRQLASGSKIPDTTVKIWDPDTGKELATLPRHVLDVTSLAYSPDGKRLVSADGVGKRLRIWNPQALQKDPGWLNASDAVSISALAFSPDSNEIVLAYRSRELYVYDFRTTRGRSFRGHSAWLNAVAYSPDGKRLASGDFNGGLMIWDATSRQEALTLTGQGITRRAAFSPDGRLLARTGNPKLGNDLKPTDAGELRVVEVPSGKELWMRPGHGGGIGAVVFSPDGLRLASAGKDGIVKVWEAATGREMLALRGPAGRGDFSDAALDLAYSADGRRLYLGRATGALVSWDAATGQEYPASNPRLVQKLASLLEGGQALFESGYQVALSPDGRLLALANVMGTVQILETTSGKEVGRFSGTYFPEALTFRRDGRVLALCAGGTGGAQISIRTVPDGREIVTFPGHGETVHQLAFSPDGSRLASASSDETVKIWETASGRELLVLAGHEGWVLGVTFSPDGRYLASNGGGMLKLWDGGPSRELFTLRRDRSQVMGLAYSRDGRRLATTQGNFGAFTLWDAATARPLFTAGDTKVRMLAASCLAFSPDGRQVALGLSNAKTDTGIVVLWDASTRTQLRELRGHTDSVLGLAFSPDGRRLASASHDRTVKLWDPASGQELLTFRGHIGRVNAVAFSPDGGRIASASRDGTVKVWDPESGREFLTLQGPRGSVGSVLLCPDLWSTLLSVRANQSTMTSVAFSPDGQRIVGSSGGRLDANCQVLVWDAHTGTQLHVLRGHRDFVWAVTFSPDGRLIASAGADHTVRLWEAVTGREVLVLRGHDDEVFRLAFSPTGHQLASAGFDGTVRIWDVTLAPLKASGQLQVRESR